MLLAHETLLLALSTWGMAYWIALIVGGGMMVFAVLGSGDSDVDIDVDVDVDVAFDADLGEVADTAPGGGASLLDWLSVRFWVFFSAMFGAIGVILTHLTELSESIIIAAALISGAISGQGIQTVMRKIRRNSGNSATEARDYVNRLARVNIPIADRRNGEVVIQVKGTQRYVPAVAPAGQTFASGDEVIVVGYRAGVAQVVAAETAGDSV